MSSDLLILFSRKDCCLCQALEKKLSDINLTRLNPPMLLSIVDIDSKEIPDDIQKMYTNQVPIIVLDSTKLTRTIELPRVPPRLKEDSLLSWIQKNLNIFLKVS